VVWCGVACDEYKVKRGFVVESKSDRVALGKETKKVGVQSAVRNESQENILAKPGARN